MLLLNDAAESLSSSRGASLQRMKVSTTTQVFEILKSAAEMRRSLSTQQLAVFKPATDEADAFVVSTSTSSSPAAGFHGPQARALRERAAYVLDKAYGGFSRVPPTVLAEIESSPGSLQAYINNLGSVEDWPDLALDTEAVQRVAVLDCRIFNLDRHSGNVLIVKDDNSNNKAHGLIPIDHSLSLPPWQDLSGAWFDWAYLPCATSPLSPSVTEHVLSLDADADAARLAELGLGEDCIATNTVCTLVLQAMVKSSSSGTGVTLKDLSDMFQRPFPKGHLQHDDALSPLEHLVALAAADNQHLDLGRFKAQVLDEYVSPSSSSAKWREWIL